MLRTLFQLIILASISFGFFSYVLFVKYAWGFQLWMVVSFFSAIAAIVVSLKTVEFVPYISYVTSIPKFSYFCIVHALIMLLAWQIDALSLGERQTSVVTNKGLWNLPSPRRGDIGTIGMNQDEKKQYRKDKDKLIAMIPRTDLNLKYESTLGTNFELNLSRDSYQKIQNGANQIEITFKEGIFGVPKILSYQVLSAIK